MAAPTHNYQTRRQRAPIYALKTELQQKRDIYGPKIPRTWLPPVGRPHMNPRSIHLPGPIPYRARCFQNVVHQSLMHVPQFLNWIRSHSHCTVPADDCVMCLYRAFITSYWQDAGAADIVVPANDPSLDRIAVLARNANVAFTAFGDAAEFYEWVVEQMIFAVPLGRWTEAHWREAQWNKEWEALFLLDFTERTQCRTCRDVDNEDKWESMIDVAFNPATMADLDQMLNVGFFDQRPTNQCTSCAAVVPHHVQRRIRAAPEVLRIKVQLTDAIAGQMMKQLHPWGVTERLDLTQYQQNTELPLRYTLSSAIAHAGSNGNQEVGGVAWAPNETPESSEMDNEGPVKVESSDTSGSTESGESSGSSDTDSEGLDNTTNYVSRLIWNQAEEDEADRREVEEVAGMAGTVGDPFERGDCLAFVESDSESSSEEQSSSDEEEYGIERIDNGEHDTDDDEPLGNGLSDGNSQYQAPDDEYMFEYQEPSDDEDGGQTPSDHANTFNTSYDRRLQQPSFDEITSTSNKLIKETPGIQQFGEYMQQQANTRIERRINGPATSISPCTLNIDTPSHTLSGPSTRTRSRKVNKDTAPHTPERGQNKCRRIGPLGYLIEVTREDYISELGPDLDNLPDTPAAPRKRKNRRALYRDSVLPTPSVSPPPMPVAVAGHVTVGASESGSDSDSEDERRAAAQATIMTHIARLQERRRIRETASNNNGSAARGPIMHDSLVPNNGWGLTPCRAPNSTEFRVGNRYWTLNPAPRIDGTHIVNVRGRHDNFHVGSGAMPDGAPHVVQLEAGELEENPQRPGNHCYRPTGYQVVVLTYTRDRLTGADRKAEENIPTFSG